MDNSSLVIRGFVLISSRTFNAKRLRFIVTFIVTFIVPFPISLDLSFKIRVNVVLSIPNASVRIGVR